MQLEKIENVIKASPAIQIQSQITHLQRRAWNVLLANAYSELPDTDIHRVSVAALAAKLGFNSHNEDYLKETLAALVECTVEWNLLGKDKKGCWGASALLASVEIKDGICTYGFAPHLRRLLHTPRVYTRLNLRLQNDFKSRYALVLWEVCFDYYDAVRKKGETPFIRLDVFRELIGSGSEEYPAFKALNRAVIKPAIREINALTNYHVEVERKRVGRKIAELKFRITLATVPSLQESVYPEIATLPPVAVELVQAGVDRKMAVRIAEQEWGFVEPERLPPPGTYPEFVGYVCEKIEMSAAASPEALKNRAGSIVAAIRENYEDPALQKARRERAERARAKALEALEAEFQAKQASLLRREIHADPDLLPRAAARITGRFVRERLERHDTVAEAYQKEVIVKVTLNSILADEFCAEVLAPVLEQYEAEKARL